MLLRYYNIYPPVNGQLYQPTLVKRIRSWYNDNATRNGLQLDRWEKKENKSPFFCGYITPQGWYKQNYVTNPSGGTGTTLTLNPTVLNCYATQAASYLWDFGSNPPASISSTTAANLIS